MLSAVAGSVFFVAAPGARFAAGTAVATSPGRGPDRAHWPKFTAWLVDFGHLLLFQPPTFFSFQAHTNIKNLVRRLPWREELTTLDLRPKR